MHRAEQAKGISMYRARRGKGLTCTGLDGYRTRQSLFGRGAMCKFLHPASVGCWSSHIDTGPTKLCLVSGYNVFVSLVFSVPLYMCCFCESYSQD
jgi:hypothetical protein